MNTSVCLLEEGQVAFKTLGQKGPQAGIKYFSFYFTTVMLILCDIHDIQCQMEIVCLMSLSTLTLSIYDCLSVCLSVCLSIC